ncbi:transposase [Streptomyces flaveolus]|uniref:transposase n=1 Tax=Streptomyces flaveolus TaxID=67297 RepID=UPI0033F2B8ED
MWERLGRDAEPTAGVIDSPSVKADAVVGTDSNGYDRGKQINGRKRHVVVDTLDLLLGGMVTSADVRDRTAAPPRAGAGEGRRRLHRQPRRALTGHFRAGPGDPQT